MITALLYTVWFIGGIVWGVAFFTFAIWVFNNFIDKKLSKLNNYVGFALLVIYMMFAMFIASVPFSALMVTL
jgi:hypothetical protein